MNPYWPVDVTLHWYLKQNIYSAVTPYRHVLATYPRIGCQETSVIDSYIFICKYYLILMTCYITHFPLFQNWRTLCFISEWHGWVGSYHFDHKCTIGILSGRFKKDSGYVIKTDEENWSHIHLVCYVDYTIWLCVKGWLKWQNYTLTNAMIFPRKVMWLQLILALSGPRKQMPFFLTLR